MHNKRVLFLAQVLSQGGVSSHLLELAKGLQAQGWSVAVASRGAPAQQGFPVSRFEASGIPHFEVPFPAYGSVQSMVRGITAQRKLAEVVKSFAPDLLHVHWRSTSLHAALIQKTHGIPYVSTIHRTDLPHTLLHRQLSFWGQRAIAVSSEARQELIDIYHLDPARIHLVYHGVDTTHFRPPTSQERLEARKQLGIEAEAPVVAMVASLYPVKRHDLLLQAIAQLQVRERIVVLLAGEGEQRAALNERAEALGIQQQTHFLGHHDARQVYWASDVMVLPSDVEGFGLVIAEGMLCGVVPVRTPAGGAYDQIEEGVSGFVIPYGDAEALAQKLEALFADPVRRLAMAEAALNRAQRLFTQDRMVAQVAAVYEEVLQGVSG